MDFSKIKIYIERDLRLKQTYLQYVFVHVLNGGKKWQKHRAIVLSF